MINMRKILIKLFIKDYQNIQDTKVRAKYGTLAGAVGIVSNILLSALKIILGVLTFSISIIADGVNNLTDGLSSLITIVGFKLSAEPADEEHPFGHERIEYITGLIISFLIIIISFTLGKEAVVKIFSNEAQTNISYITLILMVVSVAFKCWQGIFYKNMAKAIDSNTLVASSKDSFNDCISTSVVIFCIIVNLLTDGAWNIDGYAGLFVAGFILVSGIKLVIETVNPLLGSAPSKELILSLEEKIKSYDGILGIHDLVVHNYGPNRNFASVHVEVSSDVPIIITHDLIDNIEMDIRKELNIELTIHMDPVDINNPEVQKLKEVVNTILHDFDPKLTFHDFRCVFGISHTNVLFDVVIPIKYHLSSNELKEKITDLIKQYDPKLNPVINIDLAYTHI